MKNRDSLRKRFLQDSVPVRLGNLAANLARIHSYTSDTRHNDIVAHLLDESRFFVEWVAPDAELEQQFILADIQRRLTRWHFTWLQLSANLSQRKEMGNQAKAWSDKVLAMSGLLAEAMAEGEKVYA